MKGGDYIDKQIWSIVYHHSTFRCYL